MTLDLKQFEGHTPGPWVSSSVEVSANNPWAGGFEIRYGVGFVVCARAPYPERREEMAANAKLIAGAPVLLAEVERLRGEVERLRADNEHLMEVIRLAGSKGSSGHVIYE